MRRCSGCKTLKDQSEFYKNKSRKDGLNTWCKLCMRDFKKKNDWRLLGIVFSHEEYEKLFIKQNGCCSVCGLHQDNFNKALSVDHDHKTNKVRGLLCYNCNLALGHVSDSKEILLKLIKYLEK